MLVHIINIKINELPFKVIWIDCIFSYSKDKYKTDLDYSTYIHIIWLLNTFSGIKLPKDTNHVLKCNLFFPFNFLLQKSKLTNYSFSVTRLVAQPCDDTQKGKFWSEPIKIALATMLDVRLLKSKCFLVLILNAIFTSLGFFIPYMFIKDRAVSNGLSERSSFWLISTIGALNTLGRVLCGAIAMIPKACPIEITSFCLTLGGILTIISGLSFEMWAQFSFAALYGLSICK